MRVTQLCQMLVILHQEGKILVNHHHHQTDTLPVNLHLHPVGLIHVVDLMHVAHHQTVLDPKTNLKIELSPDHHQTG